MDIYVVYSTASALIIGLAFYIIATSRHLVRIMAGFVLATSGLMLFSTVVPGETQLPFLLIIVSAIEEIIGLVLIIVYNRYRRKALLGEA